MRWRGAPRCCRPRTFRTLASRRVVLLSLAIGTSTLMTELVYENYRHQGLEVRRIYF